LLFLSFVTTLLLFYYPVPSMGTHWGLMIDAGSSGSRIRIYYWQNRSSATVDPNILQYIPVNSSDEDLLEVDPGLSSYVGDPDQAGPSLQQLIEQAKRWVPRDQYGQTPVYLRATAGMRLLYTSQQNAIFASVRSFLGNPANNPFIFKDAYASIASGEQEAVWSWVCANYLAKLLTGNTLPQDYISTLELGGASTQIEFIPTDELLASQFDITVFGSKITLYAHSFLKFGKDEFRNRVRSLAVQKQYPATTINLPCFYVGYTDYWVDPTSGINYTFIGTGGWDDCYNTYTQDRMGTTVECLQANCSFFGVYQPSIPNPRTFWGISAYFYTVNGIGLVDYNGEWIGTVNDIQRNGTAQCSKTWAQALADLNTTDPSNVATYCLDATLVVSLLRAYGATLPISYARKKYGQTIGWPLGAIIDELNLLPLDLSPSSDCVSSDNVDRIETIVGVFAGVGGFVIGLALGYFGHRYLSQRDTNKLTPLLKD